MNYERNAIYGTLKNITFAYFKYLMKNTTPTNEGLSKTYKNIHSLCEGVYCYVSESSIHILTPSTSVKYEIECKVEKKTGYIVIQRLNREE